MTEKPQGVEQGGIKCLTSADGSAKTAAMFAGNSVFRELARGVVLVNLAGGVRCSVQHHLELAANGDELPTFTGAFQGVGGGEDV